MRNLIAIAVVAVTCAACYAPIGMVNNLTRFYPSGDRQSFVYRELAAKLAFDGSIPDEEGRVERLETYLDVNGMCLNGYAITEKQVVSHPTPENKPGRQKTVVYHGECL